MDINKKKAVIFAPFWRHPGHVGNYRIDRFIRWLSAEGFYIVLVRAGSCEGENRKSWGVELTVKDPLRIYIEKRGGNVISKARKPNRLRRRLAYLVFNPDPGVLWARLAARNKKVIKKSKGASFVLSSNPPESAHIGAAELANRVGSALIIDMRDGWLDEPLKPLLRNYKIQRWREGRLERKVLIQAEKIFVTSPAWKSLLVGRLPFLKDKIAVLTNGYPSVDYVCLNTIKKPLKNEGLNLVYAGRFTGSSLSRKACYLLDVLLGGVTIGKSFRGVINLFGDLEPLDLKEIAEWQPQFESKGWSVKVHASVPRDDMMKKLLCADGLLLLSESQAAIPSKLFEYLLLRKPILAVSPRGSALWEIGKNFPQFFLCDRKENNSKLVLDFFREANKQENYYHIPDDFYEENLSRVFLENLETK